MIRSHRFTSCVSDACRSMDESAMANDEQRESDGIVNSFEIYQGTHTGAVTDRSQTHVMPFFCKDLASEEDFSVRPLVEPPTGKIFCSGAIAGQTFSLLAALDHV
jgi:hypothetical protein